MYEYPLGELKVPKNEALVYLGEISTEATAKYPFKIVFRITVWNKNGSESESESKYLLKMWQPALKEFTVYDIKDSLESIKKSLNKLVGEILVNGAQMFLNKMKEIDREKNAFLISLEKSCTLKLKEIDEIISGMEEKNDRIQKLL